MTSHDLKSIFIHFPRTAGSSIEKFLMKTDDIYGPKTSVYCNKDNVERTITESHHTSKEDYIKQNGEEIWEEYFTFSFVRNPWDWFVSNFFWDLYQYEKARAEGREIKRRREFIVDECNSDFTTYLKKGASRPKWFVFTQASDFIGDVNFLGRFENLEEDMQTICAHLGIEYDNFPYENKMNREKYTNYYDSETANIVHNLFEKDIKKFNYKYGE
jgi:chondroitin 4-sulfotransferase 11